MLVIRVSLTHKHMLAHTHTFSLSLSLSASLSLALSLPLFLSLSCSLAASLSLSLHCPHTHNRTPSYTHKPCLTIFQHCQLCLFDHWSSEIYLPPTLHQTSELTSTMWDPTVATETGGESAELLLIMTTTNKQSSLVMVSLLESDLLFIIQSSLEPLNLKMSYVDYCKIIMHVKKCNQCLFSA